jgi:predicted Zn-ribbon and HTH transcriptional regulator
MLYVRQCNSCGYTIADPEGKLDGYKYNSWCFKCRSSAMSYRRATIFEKIKIFFKLMDIYKP